INDPVYNAGIGGNTTTDALFRLTRDVILKRPSVVLVELGGNDILNRYDIETTFLNLQIILQNLADTGAKLYLVKFYNYGMMETLLSLVGAPGMYTRRITTQYDEMYANLAQLYNADLIDGFWNGAWGVYMSDDIHANARGYELMAGNIFRAMQPYLEAKGMIRYTR
ncbi:MAG: GDSL-type esterase/lipase family protein, partial [Treponema sp.]|nr:GDSL-type esterase/lipase family protein [Treponema sp.]